MNNIGLHMRISSVSVNDADVESRRLATTALATKWGKDNVCASIISKAVDVANALGADGTPTQVLGGEIQMAIQKKSPSFLYEERPLDVGVCAGMAMVSIMNAAPGDTGWYIADVYAAALWSALAYQPVLVEQRRENLRREVWFAARDRNTLSADKARARIDVPDPDELDIKIDAEGGVTSDFIEVIGSTINALRRNAVLDREELDFLWWIQLGRSRLLKKQLSELAEPVRIVTSGIEGSKLLRRLPCEVHREIVLRTLDQDPELDMAELLEAIGDDRAALSAALIKANVLAHPTVFPLLYSLSTGEKDGEGANIKRRVSEWGERALLEATLSRLMSQGAGKV